MTTNKPGVKRYSITVDKHYHPVPYESDIGRWVEYSSYEALQAERDALAAPVVRGEPMAWVTADTVDGQTVNGKPRRVWWENNEGVGIPIYTPPQPAPDVAGMVGALTTQVEHWKETAAQYARNEDFYRGIVRQIGELFGEEARTSDDGSVQDDVLALKVPELVEALAAHVEEGRQLARELLIDDKTDDATQLTDWALVPHETNLARLKAKWQAEALVEGLRRMQGTCYGELRIEDYIEELRRQAEGDTS